MKVGLTRIDSVVVGIQRITVFIPNFGKNIDLLGRGMPRQAGLGVSVGVSAVYQNKVDGTDKGT